MSANVNNINTYIERYQSMSRPAVYATHMFASVKAHRYAAIFAVTVGVLVAALSRRPAILTGAAVGEALAFALIFRVYRVAIQWNLSRRRFLSCPAKEAPVLTTFDWLVREAVLGNLTAVHVLAHHCATTGLTKEAIELFQQLDKTSPKDVDWIMNQVQVFQVQVDDLRAKETPPLSDIQVSWYTVAIALRQKPLPMYWMGLNYLKHGNEKEGREKFLQAADQGHKPSKEALQNLCPS